MYKALRKRVDSNRDAGFTLIELLIVIVILGILAAIVIFAVGSARDDSVVSACAADAKTVNTASEAYKAKNGSYAADMAAIVAGGYMRNVPDGGADYTISYSGGTAACAVTP